MWTHEPVVDYLVSLKHRLHKIHTKNKHGFDNDKYRVNGRHYLELAINFPIISQIFGIGYK